MITLVKVHSSKFELSRNLVARQVNGSQFIIVTNNDVLEYDGFAFWIILAIKADVQFLSLNLILAAHAKALSDFEACQLARGLIKLENRLEYDITAGLLQPTPEPASHVEVWSHVNDWLMWVEGFT